jgi:hypothetical protein
LTLSTWRNVLLRRYLETATVCRQLASLCEGRFSSNAAIFHWTSSWVYIILLSFRNRPMSSSTVHRRPRSRVNKAIIGRLILKIAITLLFLSSVGQTFRFVSIDCCSEWVGPEAARMRIQWVCSSHCYPMNDRSYRRHAYARMRTYACSNTRDFTVVKYTFKLSLYCKRSTRCRQWLSDLLSEGTGLTIRLDIQSVSCLERAILWKLSANRLNVKQGKSRMTEFYT